jgi:uncharacterized protein YeeX (DUF496 family)
MTIEQEISQHSQTQERMLSIARQMIENKKALQKEIKDDMKNPEIRAIIDKLKERNESRHK